MPEDLPLSIGGRAQTPRAYLIRPGRQGYGAGELALSRIGVRARAPGGPTFVGAAGRGRVCGGSSDSVGA